jgi:hypothetical protein
MGRGCRQVSTRLPNSVERPHSPCSSPAAHGSRSARTAMPPLSKAAEAAARSVNSAALLVKEPTDSLLEVRQIGGERVPHGAVVDVEVPVSHSVAHASDLCPGHVWDQIGDLIEVLRCLAESAMIDLAGCRRMTSVSNASRPGATSCAASSQRARDVVKPAARVVHCRGTGLFVDVLHPTGTRGDDIDWAAQGRLELVFHRAKLEQARAGLGVDDQVHIGAWASVAARDGSENPNVAPSVCFDDAFDLIRSGGVSRHRRHPGAALVPAARDFRLLRDAADPGSAPDSSACCAHRQLRATHMIRLSSSAAPPDVHSRRLCLFRHGPDRGCSDRRGRNLIARVRDWADRLGARRRHPLDWSDRGDAVTHYGCRDHRHVLGDRGDQAATSGVPSPASSSRSNRHSLYSG